MKWAIAAITFIHGLIHLMGFFDGTGIKKMAEFSGKTLVTLPPMVKTVLAYVWALAFVMFMVALVGLVTDKDWWKVVAVVAVVISQILIVIYWKDAWAGTIANVIVVAAVLFYHSSK